MQKIISLIIFFVYIILALILFDGKVAMVLSVSLILPIGCIWFGDDFGNYVGPRGGFNIPISKKTPGSIIRFMGWVLLFLPVARYLIVLYYQ